MSRLVSFGTLRSEAYKRADLENATALIPTADAGDLVNRGIARLDRLLIRAGRGTYKPTKSTATTANGTLTIAPGADVSFSPDVGTLFNIIALYATVNGRNVNLDEFDFSELATLLDTSVAWTGQVFKYRYVNGTIYLAPPPSGAFLLTLWWTPARAAFATNGSADSSTVDGVYDYDAYVVDWAARRMAEKDENYELCARLDGSLAELEAEILNTAKDLSPQPAHVVDVSLSTASSLGRRRGPWRWR